MSDDALIHEYERGPALVREAIAGMTDAQLRARPVEGKWSTHDVVIHLADADQAFAHRLKRILAEQRPAYDAWSENDYIARLAYDQQSVDDALAIMDLTHRQMLRILRNQPAGAFDRVGLHPERGEQTARQVLEYATWHVSHHLKFVQEKRAALGLK